MAVSIETAKLEIYPKHAGEICQNLPRAFGLHAAHAGFGRASHADMRLISIDCQPQTSEPPAELAIHVEKAEMQSSRRADRDAIDHRSRAKNARACFAWLGLYTAQKSSACNT